jgi:hypothetical protein
MYLGKSVKEYSDKVKEIIDNKIKGREKIKKLVGECGIQCEQCFCLMSVHSKYERNIVDLKETIVIFVVWCMACKVWHALLPDFLLPHKHYSADEIEGVMIDSASSPLTEIEREASEPTVRRWIREIGHRVIKTVSILKALFRRLGQPISEVAITPSAPYNELEQILEMAPNPLNFSGNKLGLANIWLKSNDTPSHI